MDVVRHGLSKVRTLGANHPRSTPLKGLERKAREGNNGDTESLPRFRPPCGVKPYSCSSDGLYCDGLSTSCEFVLGFRLGRLVEEIGRPSYGGEYASYIVTPALLPAHSWREGTPHSDGGGAYARSPTSRGLGPQGTAPPSMAASWGRLVTSPSSCSVGLVFFHRRGTLWVVLWRVQWSASLYT